MSSFEAVTELSDEVDDIDDDITRTRGPCAQVLAASLLHPGSCTRRDRPLSRRARGAIEGTVRVTSATAEWRSAAHRSPRMFTTTTSWSSDRKRARPELQLGGTPLDVALSEEKLLHPFGG